MNKELLEKLFDKCYRKLYDEKNGRFYDCHNDVKQFIFETIILEVLKSVLGKDVTSEINGIDILDYEKIKQKVKSLYQIDL